jgi:broad specificity phosphatase PhoE
MRLFVISRHGESTLNVERVINGDPTRPVRLTENGRKAAERLGAQLAALDLDLCVHTRFPRTTETAQIALKGRDIPFLEEPLLDDIDVGELEGDTVDAYRDWKKAHTRRDRFPGGESLDEAAGRYARAFRTLLDRPEQSVLVVCHEIPLRYALNAAAASTDLDGPIHLIANATPYLFDEAALRRAVEHVDSLVRGN